MQKERYSVEEYLKNPSRKVVTGMIYNILEFGAAALFWWCCYRLWTAEDED